MAAAAMRSEITRVLLREREAGSGGASLRVPLELGLGFGAIAREFPTVAVVAAPERGSYPPASLEIRAEDWRAEPFDGWGFDRALDRALAASAPLAIVVEGPRGRLPRIALELLTRAQRRLGRRNRASATPSFARVLAAHRALHARPQPLVLADYDHALDTWQWLLRLAPGASLAVQLAALLHDVERLVSESERRVEHHAGDYSAFKRRHAAVGAGLAAAWLRELGLGLGLGLGLDERVVAATARLIAAHEGHHSAPERAEPTDPTGDAGGHAEDLARLADADALSFFSLNSGGFLDYFGREHTRAKIRYSLARLRPSARPQLGRMRLRADVRALVREALTSAPLGEARSPDMGVGVDAGAGELTRRELPR